MCVIEHRRVIKIVAIIPDLKNPQISFWQYGLPHHHLINAGTSAIIQLYRNSFVIS